MAAPGAPGGAADAKEQRRQKGQAYLERVLASAGTGDAPRAHRGRSSFFEPRPSGPGGPGGAPFGAGGADAPRASGRLSTSTFVRGRGVAAYVDPDVLAMGTFLEHARAGAVLALFGVTTAAQLVLAKASVAVVPGAPLLLLCLHLAPTAALCRAAAQHELVDASPPSARRALVALPHAVAHAAMALAVLCALAGGSVELFLALTAALAPPLALALDATLAQPRRPLALPPRRATAAASGAAACALCVLSERGDTAGAYLAIICWFLVWVAERAWETLLLAPPPDAEAGDALGGAVASAAHAVHAAAAALAPPGEPPAPPQAFERALYGSALPLLPLLLFGVLRGELGAVAAAELSVPSVSTLTLSAAAAAGGTAAALLATDVLDGRGLAAVTAACNVGTLLISHAVAEAPRPSFLGLLASLVAVAAGSAFKLAPPE